MHVFVPHYVGKAYMRRVVGLLMFANIDEDVDSLVPDDNGDIPDVNEANYIGRSRFLEKLDNDILRGYCDIALNPITLAFVAGHSNVWLRHGEFYRRVNIKYEHLLELLKANKYVLRLVSAFLYYD